MKIGGSVVVKSGVMDPDLGSDIAGWQGRVSAIEGDMVCVNWDGVTLEQMASSIIARCTREGWDWRRMYLGVDDLRPIDSRDTREETASVIAKLERRHAWSHIGEEGKIIREVLERVESESDLGKFVAWAEYLDERVSFPFEARVAEYQEGGPLQSGDKVIVEGIEDIDEW